MDDTQMKTAAKEMLRVLVTKPIMDVMGHTLTADKIVGINKLLETVEDQIVKDIKTKPANQQ